LIPDIKEKKHIVLLCDNESFAVASVLYTYIVMQHKKVSLCGSVEKKFASIPWYDVLRQKEPSSADLQIDAAMIDIHLLFLSFEEAGVKINAKMATAFYAAYFLRYKHFTSTECDSEIFAAVSKLILYGASYKEVQKALLFQEPLKLFRLRALLYKEFRLQNNAHKALVSFDDTMLEQSGATLDDIQIILEEFLRIAHVEEVVLIKSDEKNKIITTIKDREIEK